MGTTTKPMGTLLPGIVDSSTGGTASSGQSTALEVSIDLTALPARLDDRMLEMVRAISSSPAVVDERCPDEWFAKCMRSLSILPRRGDDDLSGELRLALYRKKLGHLPAAALSFVTAAALDRCKWFPTIAECLSIVAEWPGVRVGEKRRDKARVLVQRELNARMDEAMEALATRSLSQAEIDALPEFTKGVAAEKGYLWRWPDGRFTVKRDIRGMSDDELAAEREATAAMMVEWERIDAAKGAGQ